MAVVHRRAQIVAITEGKFVGVAGGRGIYSVSLAPGRRQATYTACA